MGGEPCRGWRGRDGGCSRGLESGGDTAEGVSAPRDRGVARRVTRAGVYTRGWGWRGADMGGLLPPGIGVAGGDHRGVHAWGIGVTARVSAARGLG